MSDPGNQLFQCYNTNGTNQPIAINLARVLQDRYYSNGVSLNINILPARVQNLIAGYLQANDPDNTILPPCRGGNYRWCKLCSISRLRKVLSNLG